MVSMANWKRPGLTFIEREMAMANTRTTATEIHR